MLRAAFISTTVAAATMPLALGVRDRNRPELLSVEAQRADLDMLWNAMLDVSVYPFRTSSRAFVEARYQSVRCGLHRALSAPQFALAIAPVFAALNDGHVSVSPPKTFMRRMAVPIRVELAGQDLVVIASWQNQVPLRSRLVALNGVPASRLRDVTVAISSGQTVALRRRFFKSRFRTVVAVITGEPQQYEASWVSRSGIAGHTSLPAHAVDLPGMAVEAANYSYRQLPNEHIGFIDYRRCEGLIAFKRFMATTVRRMRADSVRALIIDIRNNGGGSSELNDVLWSHVASKPFRQFGPVVEKASDRVKRAYGRAAYIDEYGQAAWEAPNATFITVPADDLIAPVSDAERFHGPVALLISSGTFSAAMSCASAAKDYGLAVIVGQETGEPVNSTGEVFLVTAPHSLVEGAFTTKYFVAPKHHVDGQGVVPDVIVNPTTSDIAAGRDAALLKAIAVLREQLGIAKA